MQAKRVRSRLALLHSIRWTTAQATLRMVSALVALVAAQATRFDFDGVLHRRVGVSAGAASRCSKQLS